MKIFRCKYKDECAESIPYSGKNCSQYQCYNYRFSELNSHEDKNESLSDYVNRKKRENGYYGFGHI